MKTDFIPTKVAEVELIYKTRVKATDRPMVTKSSQCYELLLPRWQDSIEHYESMKMLLLNRGNKVVGICNLSQGGSTGCILDVKIVFQYALKTHASSIIITHNHPSGTKQPSEQDRLITQKVKMAGEILDIKLFDHIIITPYDGYFSFADEGLL